MNHLMSKIALLSMLLLLLNACGTNSVAKYKRMASYKANVVTKPLVKEKPISAVSYSVTFPKYQELEQAVEFWRKTYAVWRRAEVAYHDDRYLDVVYEVIRLPGYVAEGLTQEQKQIIEQRRDYWRARLASLESKLRFNVRLTANDQQLIAKLQRSGKPLNVVLAGATDRVRPQRGTKERFKRGLEISGRYNLQFRKIFRDAGLPEELAYLPHVESSFQPAARSSAGAVGMWQFTKAAAKTFMPDHNRVDKRLDPIASAQGAARYLSYAYDKLGDWPSALTSYNHGIGGMRRAQESMGKDFVSIVEKYDGPYFGFASRNYYVQFLAARDISLNPRAFFPEGVSYELPVAFNQYLAAE